LNVQFYRANGSARRAGTASGASLAALLLCVSAACSEGTADPPGDAGGTNAGGAAGAGGRAGSSGNSASGSGGATGGTAGANAGGGGAKSGAGGATPIAGTGGTSGGAGASAGGTAGSTPTAGSAGLSSTGGVAGNGGGGSGGTAQGGTAGTGGAGTAGSAGASGGASGASGASGSSGASGASGTGGDDRCDIANEGATPPASLSLSGNLGTHDPVVIAAANRFYLFSTGDNIGAKTSSDLRSWQAAPEVFNASTRPDWIADEVPEAANLWAPDISYFGGQYHLYYSASSFGCNVSCIGHATRAALDSGSWTDHGSVICSNPGASCEGNRPDNWNAIDPNVVVDQEGTPWLSFGSFWGGLKLIELDQDGDRADTMLHSIAARPDDDGALEAPFIVRRCGYYYLFVSWDACCRGADSTYNTRVGRSTDVTGPYTDREGTPLMQGGGTLVLEGSTRFRGPGHNAVLFTDTAAYNVYHSYDVDNNGDPVLRIAELVWDEDGWPVSGGP
jgi:arabinan endo-1,5-alpha-L-arabinosidase